MQQNNPAMLVQSEFTLVCYFRTGILLSHFTNANATHLGG